MKKLIMFFLFLILPYNINAISVSGRSAILMDIDSKRIIYEKDINTRRLIASTTKIMTAIIALENGNLNDIVKVGNEILNIDGTNIYIEENEELKLIDLLYGLMLRSGNDASFTIAKHIGGTIDNFVKMMNDKAKEIGMKNTIYNNPSGLDDNTENLSTAYDLALLSIYANNNKDYLKITSTKRYFTNSNIKSFSWYNRNNLVGYKYFTSGKTGYTPKAGKTIVSTAKKNDLNLTAISLNDGNIYETSKNLYNYAFSNYKKYKILDKNRFKIDSNFYNKEVYINSSFYYPLTEIEKDKIKVLVELDKNSLSKKVGKVSVFLEDDIIYQDNVYSKNKKTSIFIRFWKWLFDK